MTFLDVANIAARVGAAWPPAIVLATFGHWLNPGARSTALFVRAHQELWILYPLCPVGLSVTSWHAIVVGEQVAYNSIMMVASAAALWWWWAQRDWPDDNRWKRRAKRAAAAVRAVGHRLVVVPR
jgi:hypothetical protein